MNNFNQDNKMKKWHPKGTIRCSKNPEHGYFNPRYLNKDGECIICTAEKIRKQQEKNEERLYCGDCKKLENYRFYERPKEFDKEPQCDCTWF